jgi:hypothetical protein
VNTRICEVERWRHRLEREPELAGWFVDWWQNDPGKVKQVPEHHIFLVIAEALGKKVSEVDWDTLSPDAAEAAVVLYRSNLTKGTGQRRSSEPDFGL